MEMAHRDRWKTAIATMRRVLSGFAMKEEPKWGKPTYTVNGKNVVILQHREGDAGDLRRSGSLGETVVIAHDVRLKVAVDGWEPPTGSRWRSLC